MDARAEPDHELEGAADLIEEAAGDARASARWIRDNLRETLDALGMRDVTGSDPDDT